MTKAERLLFGMTLSAAAYAGAAAAQTSATKPDFAFPKKCALSQKARLVTSLKDVPAVAAEFVRQKLAVAEVGEQFVPYDVVDSSLGLPHRQFVRGYIFSDRTIVWYWHGGFATHPHIIEMREQRDEDTGQLALRLQPLTLTGPPCAATQALLDGVRSLGPGEW